MAKKLQLRRGTTSQHSSFTGAVGEVTVDTDKKVVVVHDGSTAGGIPLSKASDAAELIDEDDFSSNTATKAPSQQSTKAYIAATSQPLDADLTSLAGCQTGAAAALASLTSTEVAILDGATVTTAELNYVDGVTSAVQTQLDAKPDLTDDQTWTGSQRGAIETEALTGSGDTRTLTLDFNTGNNFYVDLVGSVTSVAISNPTVGQSGSIIINQSVGSKTIGGWNSAFKFSGGTAPTITVTQGKFDRIDYFIYTTTHIQVVWSGNY